MTTTAPTTAPTSGRAHVKTEQLIHLRAGGVSVLLQIDQGLPVIHHWGADLGDLGPVEVAALVRANQRQVTSNMPDAGIVVSLLPEQSRAHLGTPGIEGHRDGADFSTRFQTIEVHRCASDQHGQEVAIEAVDQDAHLQLSMTLQLLPSGVFRVRCQLTNTASSTYSLQSVMPVLPVPSRATQLAHFTGRHLKERSEQRHQFTVGTHIRESRRGRTGSDASLLMLAGEDGFTSRSGEVWGVHVAWSGNHRMLAERTPIAEAVLGGGELLLAGEVSLTPGQTYDSPWLYGSYGNGLDELATRFHDFLRARPQHPRTPRPVTVNVWEAVYFEHDLSTLVELAKTSASLGVERFVLDDGWFLGRRHDRAGLGDWVVDPAVWPLGLHPLVEQVRHLGMQFGLWVEPEMISPDSDVARAHPDWIMGTGRRMAPVSRHQQVLDLTNTAAWHHVYSALDALVSEYELAYLKWDHNRDLIEAGHGLSGRAGVHAQTLSAYRLMDALKAKHPGLEIESCSSGGARVDLEVLERADRVWASDCIDALERQDIQRNTELLLPPELIGAHIGSSANHSTGRVLDVDFRAATALGFHLGVEWDLAGASPQELEALRGWIAFHKTWRGLLHTGRVVHADTPDPALRVRGVVSRDGSQALFTVSAVATSLTAPAGRITLPGLISDSTYRVTLDQASTRTAAEPGTSPVAWSVEPTVMTGTSLALAGLQTPVTFPGRSVIITCEKPADGQHRPTTR